MRKEQGSQNMHTSYFLEAKLSDNRDFCIRNLTCHGFVEGENVADKVANKKIA